MLNIHHPISLKSLRYAISGIGKATARALAAMGCSVAIHYNAAAVDAEALVQELEAPVQGIKARAFQADLSSYDAVRKLYSDVKESMGDPTILFNNAGANSGKSGVQVGLLTHIDRASQG